MNTEVEGFVLYYKDRKVKKPFGVVSNNNEIKAKPYYIPTRLKKQIISIEDKRFYNHCGIDIWSIGRAFLENIKSGKIMQGGSSITQQLARNMFNNNNKTVSRKIREAISAIKLENKFSKEEILNLYFEYVYYGKNIRGLRSASLYYFGKETENLNQSQFLFLITILRGPNFYNNNPTATIKRYNFLNDGLLRNNLISKNTNIKNTSNKINKEENKLEKIKSEAIPFITENLNIKTNTITSSIEIKMQEFLKEFVSSSNKPISIIALRKGKVIGFSSYYGSDYPFIAKNNVGSTLKPIIYCYLREQGISNNELFPAYNNSTDWVVKEVSWNLNTELNLNEALYNSNNNAFINAANKIGMEKTLSFLQMILPFEGQQLFPSTILGATTRGLSLFELASIYSTFFNEKNRNIYKDECLGILNQLFFEKLGMNVSNSFLKTGTTNNNKEQYVVLGNEELTFAILRNQNDIKDTTKGQTLMELISTKFKSFFRTNANYTWTI